MTERTNRGEVVGKKKKKKKIAKDLEVWSGQNKERNLKKKKKEEKFRLICLDREEKSRKHTFSRQKET